MLSSTQHLDETHKPSQHSIFPKASKNLYIETTREMKISNKRKFNKINLCDLMKELGRNFACLEINKAFNTLSKNHSAQGFEGCVVMNCNKNSELKTKSPLPQAGEGNKNCHCERSEAIQEEMVSNRLLRRFTPRNDSNSSENKKKVGVK